MTNIDIEKWQKDKYAYAEEEITLSPHECSWEPGLQATHLAVWPL